MICDEFLFFIFNNCKNDIFWDAPFLVALTIKIDTFSGFLAFCLAAMGLDDTHFMRIGESSEKRIKHISEASITIYWLYCIQHNLHMCIYIHPIRYVKQTKHAGEHLTTEGKGRVSVRWVSVSQTGSVRKGGWIHLNQTCCWRPTKTPAQVIGSKKKVSAVDGRNPLASWLIGSLSIYSEINHPRCRISAIQKKWLK